MFKHVEHEIIRPFAIAEHTKNGHYYRTNEGKLYPSITTVFKELDNKEWYGYWVASIAKKENISEEKAEIRCKEIGNNSLEMGNKIHKLAEDYLNNGKYVLLASDKKDYIEELDPAKLFTPLMLHLSQCIGEVHGVEKEIYSDEMEIAGTVDLIAEHNGVLSVIDFKNSRKPKTNSECKKKKYYEQVCAYGKMWEQCTGEKIKQGVVIVVSWDGKVKEFIVKLDDYEEDLWLDLAKFEQKKALNTI